MRNPVLSFAIAVFLTCWANFTLADEVLFSSIGQRLQLMKAVAHYKFERRLPIEDLARETIVIEQAVNQGRRQGLKPETTARFFRAQIQAAKQIQNYWFEQWQMQPPVLPAPRLIDTRAALLRLGDRIVANLNQAIAPTSLPQFLEATQVEGLSASRQSKLFTALSDLAFYPDYTTQIQDQGVVRIGITLDYAPFSYGTLEQPLGIDVELGQKIANSLGVDVAWIQTSWPKLTEDFIRGRFDLAMGGVSITPLRLQAGFFSEPYHVGGKTPIGRCADQRRFTDVASIDQPQVRIIVNPGGTNAKFARAHIAQAEILSFPDNRFIFEEIRANRADVMFTDAIEVSLQTLRHPDLCALMPGRHLTHQEKAIWMPQDRALKANIDRLITQLHQRDEMTTLFRRWLKPRP